MTTHRRRLIADALGRSPETILELDNGYDFEVAIVDDEWVFRFPRRAGVEEALEVEIVLLPALAPVLPVDVPSLEHISRDPLFVGYRLIRGEPLVDEDADGVHAFLEALHALDPTGLPVERPVWVEAYLEQCAEFERLVLPLLDKDRRQEAKRSSGRRRPSSTSPCRARRSRGHRQALSPSVRRDALIDPPPVARFAYCE